MSPPSRLSRRDFLGSAAAASLAGLAGCLGGPRYDADALADALADARTTPIPRVPPPPLPLPENHVSAVRESAESRATSLAARLDGLPAGVDPDGRATSAATSALARARTFLTESRGQSPPASLDSIRHARGVLGEGHGWLDAASGAAAVTERRERRADLARVVADTWTRVEYRATTVPVGVYTAGETEASLDDAAAALDRVETALANVDRATEETRRQYWVATAAGDIAYARGCVSDAAAVAREQRERVFENTGDLRDPMREAASVLLDAVGRDVRETTPVPDDASPVVHDVFSALGVRSVDDAERALGADRPALALVGLRWRMQDLAARDELDSGTLSTPRDDDDVVARDAAVEALRAATRRETDAVERVCLRRGVRSLEQGDARLSEAVDAADGRESQVAAAAEDAYVEYAVSRGLVAAARPTAERVVEAVEEASDA